MAEKQGILITATGGVRQGQLSQGLLSHLGPPRGGDMKWAEMWTAVLAGQVQSACGEEQARSVGGMESAALWTSRLAGPGVTVVRVQQQQGLGVPSEDGGVPFQWLTWLDLGLQSLWGQREARGCVAGKGQSQSEPRSESRWGRCLHNTRAKWTHFVNLFFVVLLK